MKMSKIANILAVTDTNSKKTKLKMPIILMSAIYWRYFDIYRPNFELVYAAVY